MEDFQYREKRETWKMIIGGPSSYTLEAHPAILLSNLTREIERVKSFISLLILIEAILLMVKE